MNNNLTRKLAACASYAAAMALAFGAGGSAARAQFNQFQSALGGPNWDGGYQAWVTTQDGGIIPTWDENLIMVGESRSYGNDYDVYVAQIDPCGDLMWSMTYDLGGDDHGRKIRQCPDGGYIIVGSTDHSDVPGQTRDAFLLKIDRFGTVLWANGYGVTGRYNRDDGKDVRVDMVTGDIYACGYTKSSGAGSYDGWIWKTTAAGGFVWSNTYGDVGDEYLNALDLGCHGSIVATGATTSYSPLQSQDLWNLKVNTTTGAVIWATRNGGEGEDEGKGITMDADGYSFYVVGYTSGNPRPGMQEYAGKYGCAEGEATWETVVGDPNPANYSCLTDVQYDAGPNPGIWTVGNWQTYGASNANEVHLMHMNTALLPGLSRRYHGPNYGEFGYSLTQTLFDGNPRYGIAMTGTTTSFGKGLADVYAIGTDLNGVSGCNEEDVLPLVFPFERTHDYVTPIRVPFPRTLTIPHHENSNTDFTRVCSQCHPVMIAPPGGGGGLSQSLGSGSDALGRIDAGVPPVSGSEAGAR